MTDLSPYVDIPFEATDEETGYKEKLTTVTAVRKFVCKWEDRMSYPPKLGQVHPNHPEIRCTDRDFHGEGPAQPSIADPSGVGTCLHTYAFVTCTYERMSTQDTDVLWDFHGGTEVLEVGLGRYWRYAGTVCDQSITITSPFITARASKVMLSDPRKLGWSMECMGRVNAYYWQPTLNSPRFGPETLLYLYPDVEEWYDAERSAAIGSPVYFYRCSFNFLWRPCGHNIQWRAPRQAYDEVGAPLVDPTTGDPIFVEGIAGVPGWDYPVPRLYQIADFGPMMGLPPSIIPFEDGAGMGGS